MKILWRDGECSVKAITAVLSEVKITAYTSVQTMCKIMAEKGYVEFRKDGRAFLYSAVLSETDAQQSALKTLLNRFFGGSSQLLTQHLMTQSDIDMDALQELQDKLDRKSKDDK